MIIRYQGHAFFTLEMENGTTIAMDPYDELYQYPKRKLQADTVTIALLGLKEEMDAADMGQMQEWLKTRTGAKKMKLVVE